MKDPTCISIAGNSNMKKMTSIADPSGPAAPLHIDPGSGSPCCTASMPAYMKNVDVISAAKGSQV